MRGKEIKMINQPALSPGATLIISGDGGLVKYNQESRSLLRNIFLSIGRAIVVSRPGGLIVDVRREDIKVIENSELPSGTILVRSEDGSLVRYQNKAANPIDNLFNLLEFSSKPTDDTSRNKVNDLPNLPLTNHEHLIKLVSLSNNIPHVISKDDLEKLENIQIIFKENRDIRQYVGRTIVTLVILFSALFIILSRKFSEGDNKWAYGAIGAILGYWLA